MAERFRQGTDAGMRYATIRGQLPVLMAQDHWDVRKAGEDRFGGASQAWQGWDDTLLDNFPPGVVAIDLGYGHVIRRSEVASAGVRPEDRLTWTLTDINGYGQTLAEQCGMPWEPLVSHEE